MSLRKLNIQVEEPNREICHRNINAEAESSLVAKWLGLCTPLPETQVGSLIRELRPLKASWCPLESKQTNKKPLRPQRYYCSGLPGNG